MIDLRKPEPSRVVDNTLRSIPAVRAVGGPTELLAAGRTINEDRRERGVLTVARDLLLAPVSFAVLCWRLVRDSRTPMVLRVALVATVGYAISPLDPIPDFLPVIGMLDDVLVVAIALRWIIRKVDPELLREHWSGSAAMLRAIVELSGR